MISAAFSDDVINKGLNSELLEVADGHVMVVRVAEHEPAKIQDLDVVKDQVKDTLIVAKAREQLIDKGQQVVAQLDANPGGINTVASELNLPVENAGTLLRNDSSVPTQIIQRVFSIASEDNLFPVIDGIQLDDGKYAVIQLNEIIEVEEDSATVEQAEWISVEGHYGRREINAMIQALRETGDVVIFPENLE